MESAAAAVTDCSTKRITTRFSIHFVPKDLWITQCFPCG